MENYNGTISVHGRGSIHVVPDVTRLEVMIESVFVNYETAYKQARENTIRDPRPYQLKILERAVKDAQEKAEMMAKAAGCKLGEVDSITYGKQELTFHSQARFIHSNKEAMTCDANSLNIEPDDLVMSDSVDVSWNLVKIETS